MKVSWIKFIEDKKDFKLPENLGFDVFSINRNDNVDEKIDELISDNYSIKFYCWCVRKDKYGISKK